MANAKSIFEQVLFEDKEKKTKKNLKIFYNIDIFIKEEQNFNPLPQNQTPTVQQPVQQPLQQQVATAPVEQIPMESYFKNEVRRLTLNEESIDNDKKGIIEVGAEEIENIQTIEDLVDFLVDQKKPSGLPIFDEFLSELVLTITGSGELQLSDLLQKDDKVLVEIDYGSDKTDSVGFKILKRSGVQNISIMMKKDGNILPNKFDIADFNTMIIAYRNDVLGS